MKTTHKIEKVESVAQSVQIQSEELGFLIQPPTKHHSIPTCPTHPWCGRRIKSNAIVQFNPSLTLTLTLTLTHASKLNHVLNEIKSKVLKFTTINLFNCFRVETGQNKSLLALLHVVLLQQKNILVTHKKNVLPQSLHQIFGTKPNADFHMQSSAPRPTPTSKSTKNKK